MRLPFCRRDELGGFWQRCGIALGHVDQAGCGRPLLVDHTVPAGGEVYVGRAYPDTAGIGAAPIDYSCKLRPAVMMLGSSR